MGVVELLVAVRLVAPVPGEPVLGPRAAEPSAAAAAPEPSTTPIGRVILRVDGLPWEEVHLALVPRLPGVEIVRFEDAGFAEVEGELLAYVELSVAPGEGEQVDLTIVLSDRRAYLRHFTPEAGRSLRSIAITVANTLAAIEQEQIAPDDQDQEIPRPPPPPRRSEPAPAPAPAPAPVEPEPPPFELGLAAAMHPTFGLAPATVRGFAALAGELRVSMHHEKGARVELGVRVGGWSQQGYRLWRNRLHVAGGYAWRRDRFGIAAVIGPTVEPWRVRRDGVVVTAAPQGPGLASPLFGAMMAITPSLRFEVAPSAALGLGLRTELAVSVLRSGAAGRVVDPPAVLFGFGGLELTTALELTVWIWSKKLER